MNSILLLSVLRRLGMHGALDNHVHISTSELGTELGMSQQTVSRWLNELAKKGWIDKVKRGRNIYVRISPLGAGILKRAYFEYITIFGTPEIYELRGMVISGIGEGSFYMSREGYKKQVIEKLGFNPFPGTLNVKLHTKYVDVIERIREREGVLLKGFEENGRKYGRVHAYFATLNDYLGALVIPEMSHYKDVVEIISDKSLRKLYSLSDGAEVKIMVFL